MLENTTKRGNALFLLLSLASCVLLITFYFNINIQKPASGNKAQVCPANVQAKNILYWTGMFGSKDFYLSEGSEMFQDCEVSNCCATSWRDDMPVDQFDAVLFHANEFLDDENYTKSKNRSWKQRYVYVNLESPSNTGRWNGSSGFYNWTMTYRSDSDIWHPYGYHRKTTTHYKMPTVEEVKRKPHTVAWMVSHCETESKREVLYKNLNEYIPIHVYGFCGDRSCTTDDFDGCYDLLAQHYKFYLSFENSICLDYATEKLYAALMRNVVPIVYGGADYTRIAPPNSVIDATKFNSVKELAEYIKELDANPEKYLAYFEWKKTYVVSRDQKPLICALCKKLNEPLVHKSYYDINKWWTERMCRFEDKLPKIIPK